LKRGNNNRITSIRVYYQIYSRIPTNSDWIALYKRGMENNYYVTYKYVDSRIPFVEFEAPREVYEYEFRYHSGSQPKTHDVVRSDVIYVENTDIIVAESDGGVIAVSWDIHSQEKTSSDWIALFKVTEANNRNFIGDYKYVDINSNATVFLAPTEPGEYEIRYFSYNVGRYTTFRKSNPVIIN